MTSSALKYGLISQLFARKKEHELICLRAIKGGDVKARYVPSYELVEPFIDMFKDTHDLYFGVCTYREAKPQISYVDTAYCLWADLDAYKTKDEKEQALQIAIESYLPPSYVVDSGGGYHLYWFLDKPSQNLDKITELCMQLELIIPGAGAVSDVSRILRIPLTLNHKEDLPRHVTPVLSLGFKYSLEDLELGLTLEPKLMNKITSDSMRGYKSASEKDWAVITSLVSMGFDDSTIRNIFVHYPVGEKFRKDAPEGGEAYLEHTIQRARENTGIDEGTVAESKANFGGIFEEDQCYWVITKGGTKEQLSTGFFL